MSKKDEIKQVLIDCIYTADAKPRFLNDNWVGGDVDDKLKRIDETVDKVIALFKPSPEDIAYEMLCPDEDYSIEEMIVMIQEQDAIDGEMMIDYVDGVSVWQKLEFEFTCHDFLVHIGLKVG